MARQLDTVRQWPRSVLGLVIGLCLSLCWWPMNFQCCCCSSCLSPCCSTSCCCFAWFVQPAISNFTHTCSHMTREEEKEWDREIERERALWRPPSFVSSAHVPRVEPRTSGEHFRFHVAREKGWTKGVAITHTHAHTYAPTLTNTHACGERHTFTRHMGASCKVKINPSIRAQKHNKHCAVANDVRGVLLNICSLYMYEHDSVLRIKYINLLDRT